MSQSPVCSEVHSGDTKMRAAGAWPVERVLFAMAGVMALAGAALSALVSPWFLLLVVFTGINQLLYVTAGNCGASLMLKRFAGLKSVVYPER